MNKTYEIDQPWVVYTCLMTDAGADANGGVARINMRCAICGEHAEARIQLPPPGEPVPAPEGGRHAARVAFLAAHEHRLQRRAPETWAMPLLNPAAHSDTMDILRDVAERARRAAPADGRGEGRADA
jgi:hypothetical protein